MCFVIRICFSQTVTLFPWQHLRRLIAGLHMRRSDVNEAAMKPLALTSCQKNYKVINLCSCLTEGRASLSAMSLSINNQCQDCLSQYVLLAAAWRRLNCERDARWLVDRSAACLSAAVLRCSIRSTEGRHRDVHYYYYYLLFIVRE